MVKDTLNSLGLTLAFCIMGLIIGPMMIAVDFTRGRTDALAPLLSGAFHALGWGFLALGALGVLGIVAVALFIFGNLIRDAIADRRELSAQKIR